jgi:hypothetical protein
MNRRWRWWPSLVLCMVLAAAARAAPPTGESLRVAVHLGALLRDATHVDVEVSLRVWAEEMMRVLEVPAEVFFYPTMSEIRRDLNADRVNFVIADGLDLLNYFAPDELTDGFGGQAPNEDKLLLLTRKSAGVRDVRDLAGKHVLLLKDNALAKLWLETLCLRTFHKPCAKAGVILSTESRSRQLILKLFFDKADAVLVRGYAYETALELNPQIRDRTDVLERIAVYPGALGLFGSRVSSNFRDYVIARVPHMHDHPRGRQLLEVMQTERVGPIAHALLDPIRDLVREHQALAARYAITSEVSPQRKSAAKYERGRQ